MNDSDCNYLNEKELWQEKVKYFIKELEEVKSEIGTWDSKLAKKIEQLETTFKNSLGFVQELVQREVNRNDNQEDDLESFSVWRAEIQEQLAELFQELREIRNSDFKNMENILNQSLSITLESVQKALDTKLSIYEDREKKRSINKTEIILKLLAFFTSLGSAGGVIYLIIEKAVTK